VSVRGKPVEEWVDFRILCGLEPLLLRLLRRAQNCHRDKSARFCANEEWYGCGAHNYGWGLKRELAKLVGYQRSDEHPVLSTEHAYDLAYDTIYEALPNCRGSCACL
jgi:hypothetical protein